MTIWLPIALTALVTLERIRAISVVDAHLKRIGIAGEVDEAKTLVWSIFAIWGAYSMIWGS